jgi:RecA/RadA recombinase
MKSQLVGMESLVDLNSILDTKAHAQGLMFTAMDASLRVTSGLSTGLYSFDLMLGGAIAPGRFTYFYGDTGTAKSTLMYHAVKSSLDNGIVSVFNDHEGSVDPTYLKKLGIDLEKVCGVRNKKGSWTVTPKLRYAVGTTAEATFKFMNQVMSGLPDKIRIWDSKGEEYRYFLIAPDFQYKAVTWAYINKALKADKAVEVENMSAQMVFVTDSLKAMLPEAKDEDLDKDPIALQARCFSSNFPLIKSLLARKNCIYLATNHLTINPMAKFASPESEPGGKAVQFYPDAKIKMHTNRAKSKIIEEDHVSGEGKDRYLVGNATILKNKSGPCFRELPYRIWLDERGIPGKGLDPVFDAHTFLDACGLLEQHKKGVFGIKLKKFEGLSYNWSDFKKLVLNVEEEQSKNLHKQIKSILADGSALDAFYANAAGVSSTMNSMIVDNMEVEEEIIED